MGDLNNESSAFEESINQTPFTEEIVSMTRLGRDEHQLSLDCEFSDYPEHVSLLACSGEYFVAGTKKGFILGETKSLRKYLDQSVTDFEIRAIPIAERVHHVNFTANGAKVIIAVQGGAVKVLNVQDILNTPKWTIPGSWSIDGEMQSKAAPPSEDISLGEEITYLRPNPSNTDLVAVCLKDDRCKIINLMSKETVVELCDDAKSMCWSPGGDQIVCGKADGKLVCFDMQGEVTLRLNPPQKEGSQAALLVLWMEDTVFLVTYKENVKEKADEDEEDEKDVNEEADADEEDVEDTYPGDGVTPWIITHKPGEDTPDYDGSVAKILGYIEPPEGDGVFSAEVLKGVGGMERMIVVTNTVNHDLFMLGQTLDKTWVKYEHKDNAESVLCAIPGVDYEATEALGFVMSLTDDTAAVSAEDSDDNEKAKRAKTINIYCLTKIGNLAGLSGMVADNKVDDMKTTASTSIDPAPSAPTSIFGSLEAKPAAAITATTTAKPTSGLFASLQTVPGAPTTPKAPTFGSTTQFGRSSFESPVFGNLSLGSGASTATATTTGSSNIFGSSQGSNTFKSASTFGSTGTFGSTSTFGSSQGPNAFGSTSTFGSTTAFGSTSAFGSPSTFGSSQGSNTPGSASTFGSTFGSSTTPSNSGAISFSSLKAKPDTAPIHKPPAESQSSTFGSTWLKNTTPPGSNPTPSKETSGEFSFTTPPGQQPAFSSTSALGASVTPKAEKTPSGNSLNPAPPKDLFKQTDLQDKPPTSTESTSSTEKAHGKLGDSIATTPTRESSAPLSKPPSSMQSPTPSSVTEETKPRKDSHVQWAEVLEEYEPTVEEEGMARAFEMIYFDTKKKLVEVEKLQRELNDKIQAQKKSVQIQQPLKDTKELDNWTLRHVEDLATLIKDQHGRAAQSTPEIKRLTETCDALKKHMRESDAKKEVLENMNKELDDVNSDHVVQIGRQLDEETRELWNKIKEKTDRVETLVQELKNKMKPLKKHTKVQSTREVMSSFKLNSMIRDVEKERKDTEERVKDIEDRLTMLQLQESRMAEHSSDDTNDGKRSRPQIEVTAFTPAQVKYAERLLAREKFVESVCRITTARTLPTASKVTFSS